MPLKKIKRKPASERKKKMKILFDSVTMMKPTDLKPHPQNPNQGDIDMIVESMAENGVYRPIVWNKRNGLIAAGHHQWLAMRQEGYEEVPVVVIDVDEKTHLKILLADNATADRRTYNDNILDKVLQSLSDITGTGYTEMDVAEIHERASQAARTALEGVQGRPDGGDVATDAMRRARGGGELGDEYEDGEEDGDVGGDDTEFQADEKHLGLDDMSAELAGAFALKDDMVFDGVGKWGIPRIRTDNGLLCTWEDIPDNFRAWAGSATKDWPDPETHWLYNVGIDSLSGMPRDEKGLLSKVIVAFYCFDQYFENYWHDAAKKTTRMLNAGVTRVVMPDFSMHTPGAESRVLSMWSLYRNRWLGRYFQEAGLKLIPEVTWATGDEDFLTRYILPTLPKKMPLLCIQIQTIDADSPLVDEYPQQLQLILDTLQPKDLLIYHGKQGKKIFDDGLIKFKGRIRFVESRLYALSEQAKTREKKKGL